MKHRPSLTVTALFALAVCSAIAQTDANRMRLSADESAFITTALEGGMAEVELGTLAQQQGSSDAVKQFGKQMVEDHTKVNDELKILASNKGVPVPTALDAKSAATKDRLSKLSGAEFGGRPPLQGPVFPLSPRQITTAYVSAGDACSSPRQLRLPIGAIPDPSNRRSHRAFTLLFHPAKIGAASTSSRMRRTVPWRSRCITPPCRYSCSFWVA